MNRICRRAVVVAGVLALSGGTVLTAALPASAQPIFANNYSYGAQGFINSHLVALAEDDGLPVAMASSFNFQGKSPGMRSRHGGQQQRDLQRGPG